MLVRYYHAADERFYNGRLRQVGDTYYVEHLDDGPARGGLYLSPGWIDLHTHIFDGFGLFGTNGDAIGCQTGVCLTVDAGTVGEYTYPGFMRYVAPALRTNFRLFLCISPIGVIFHHDYNAMEYLSAERTMEFVQRHPQWIAGIKVRMGSETIRHEGLEPLRIASEAAHGLGLPMMVHIGGLPPYLADMEPFFAKGDIVTHAFNGRGGDAWGADGRPSQAMRRLIEKGVVLDVGHGSSSFDFTVLEAALRHPLPKLTFGSDLHVHSRQHYVHHMGCLLSKLYGCGISLEELMYGLTKGPAQILRLPRWCDLQPLHNATLFKIVNREQTYEDCQGNRRTFAKAIEPVAVILNGSYMALAENGGVTK